MSEKTYRLAELFNSYQGEYPYIGRYSTFIRFYKCNLDCVFDNNSSCDTMYTPYTIKYQETKYSDIYNLVSKTNFITFTGGEPLLFTDDIIDITVSLLEDNVYLDKVTIETNGLLLKNEADIYNALVSIFKVNIYSRYNIIWSPKFLDDKLIEKNFTILYELYNPQYMFIKIVASPKWQDTISDFISTAISLYGLSVKPKISLMIMSNTNNDKFTVNEESKKLALSLAEKFGINVSDRLHINLNID